MLVLANLATPADTRRLANAGLNGHVWMPIGPKGRLATVGAFLGTVAAAETA